MERSDTRRAVKDEGGTDIRLFQQHLGLQQFKLEADGPQVLAQQEIGVLKGEPVRRILGLRTARHLLGYRGVAPGGRKDTFRNGKIGRASCRERVCQYV